MNFDNLINAAGPVATFVFGVLLLFWSVLLFLLPFIVYGILTELRKQTAILKQLRDAPRR